MFEGLFYLQYIVQNIYFEKELVLSLRGIFRDICLCWLFKVSPCDRLNR